VPPPDIVLVDGVVYALPESSSSGVKLPLELLWKDPEARLELSPTPGGSSATGLWRGYVAIWEVADKSLVLDG